MHPNRPGPPRPRRPRRPRPRGLLSLVVAAALAAGVPVVAAVPHSPAPALLSPLDGPVSVLTPFDPPDQRWLRGHRGVDLAGSPGGMVRAAGAGTVLFAGPVGGRPVVSVAHGHGLRTTYEPVRPGVRAGDAVDAGDAVGTLLAGHPGCPVAACLHWGARVSAGSPSGDDDDYVDPLQLLAMSGRPIRLKPTLPGDGVG